MTSKTYLSVFGSDDKKHDLERKFGYKYRALERVYPNADKLPDDEIQKAIDVFYEGSPNEDTDVMLNRVKDYTAKNEPIWKEKYFNPKPKPMQTTLSQPQMPNLMQKPKLKGFGDYMAENVADMAYGADRALSGATFGGYDWLKRKTGLGVNERDYLNMKRYNDGTDKFAKIGGNIAQYGAEALSTGYGLYKGVQGIDNAITGYTRYRGRNELINQLKRGNDFSDINFGKVNPDTMRNINQLRENGNLPLLKGNAYLPANVVKKFYDKRLNEGYTPEQMAEMGKRLFHQGPNMVSESRYPHIQQVVYPRTNTADYGYISQNPINGQTVIKSMYKNKI